MVLPVPLPLLLISLGIAAARDANPGFKAHVPEKGLQFLGQFGKKQLLDVLENSPKFRMSGTINSRTSFELQDMEITRHSPRFKSRVQLVPGVGIEWKVSRLTMRLDGKYSYKYSSLSGSGNMYMWIYRMTSSVVMSGEKVRGALKPILEQCTVNIGLVEIRLDGAIDRLFLRFKRGLNRVAKNYLQNKLCELFQESLYPKFQRTLMNVPTSAHLFDSLFIDYALQRDPEFGEQFAETRHVGQVFARRRQSGAWRNAVSMPFEAPPLISPSGSEKMIYLYLSNYTVATLMFWLEKMGTFDYDFSKGKVPKAIEGYLRTHCDDICAGTLYSSLENFPEGSYLSVRIKRKGLPNTSVEDGKIVFASTSEGTGYIQLPNGTETKILSTDIDFKMDINKMKLDNYRLTGKLEFASYKLRNVESTIEEIDEGSLDFLVAGGIDAVVTPDLAGALKTGLKLPRILDFEMVDGDVKFEKDLITVSSDFCHPEECAEIRKRVAKEREKERKEEKTEVNTTRRPVRKGRKKEKTEEEDTEEEIYDY